MARQLETNHANSLEHCTMHTVIVITLGDADGTVLPLASADIDFNGDSYSGLLKVEDALNMELTAANDGMNFTITNLSLFLGIFLINTPNVLDGTAATVFTYFRNNATGETWLDEKLSGEIQTGEIDGDSVPCFFKSDIDAAEYKGVTISTLFPDANLPNATPELPPVYNDIEPYRGGGIRGKYPEIDEYPNGGRYQLPYFVY